MKSSWEIKWQTQNSQLSSFSPFSMSLSLLPHFFDFSHPSPLNFLPSQRKISPILNNGRHELESSDISFKPSYETYIWSVEPWPKWIWREHRIIAERKGSEEEWRAMTCIFHLLPPTESYCPDFMFITEHEPTAQGACRPEPELAVLAPDWKCFFMCSGIFFSLKYLK